MRCPIPNVLLNGNDVFCLYVSITTFALDSIVVMVIGVASNACKTQLDNIRVIISQEVIQRKSGCADKAREISKIFGLWIWKKTANRRNQWLQLGSEVCFHSTCSRASRRPKIKNDKVLKSCFWDNSVFIATVQG